MESARAVEAFRSLSTLWSKLKIWIDFISGKINNNEYYLTYDTYEILNTWGRTTDKSASLHTSENKGGPINLPSN